MATATNVKNIISSGSGGTLTAGSYGNRHTTTAPFVQEPTRHQRTRGDSQVRSASGSVREGNHSRGRGESSSTREGTTTARNRISIRESRIGEQNQQQPLQRPQLRQQPRQFHPQRGRGTGVVRSRSEARQITTSRGIHRTEEDFSHERARGRGSTPSTAELGQALGGILARRPAQPQFPNTLLPQAIAQGPASREGTPQTYTDSQALRQATTRNRRVVLSHISTKDTQTQQPRSALGTFTPGEIKQLENGAGGRGRQGATIRQPRGSLWVQDENWIGGGINHNPELNLVPTINLNNMADGNGNVFSAARGSATRGRGRGGSGEGSGGGGRGRGGFENGNGRGRGGADGGSTRGRGRGRGGGDGTAARGAARGGRGGRGRGGNAAGSGVGGAEVNGYGSGYGSGYESGGGEGPGSLFITDGNDTDVDSEMESERENGGRGSREDRANRFSEGTTGHHKMAQLKAARERERADLIRRGIIDDPNNRKPLSEALTFVGTCMDMCPLFEREERQFQKSVDKLEIDPTTGLIDAKRAVKAFHRPAAGNESALPSDVRPPRVLVKTLNYLVKDIVGGNQDLMNTHGFVRDRTRGIRQDFTLQNYRGLETIDCHERIARYHILCIHQLAQDDRFVLQQEMEQLQKTMTTLNELYDDAKMDGIPCPNEPEFRAYQILIYIHDTECQRYAQKWDFTDTDPGVQQALRLHQTAFRNAPRFFNLLRRRETTYLMGCIAEAHFYHIRKEHIRKMKTAYNKDTTAVTLADVERQLGFDHKSDLDRYLEHFGIETALDGQGEEYIVPNRNFDDSRPQLRPTCNQQIVEAKRQGRKIPEVINGVIGQVTKLKSRAGPFQEDFSQEVDTGPRKIQSWVPDEEDEYSGMQGQSWGDSQAYSNPLQTYQQNTQGFPQVTHAFQQQHRGQSMGNVFQKQKMAPSGGFPQNSFDGKNNQPSSFQENSFQQKAPAFQQQGDLQQQQPPSAFQQAMSTFSKPVAPAFSKPHSVAPAFNPKAPAFQPPGPAFQKTGNAFQKPPDAPNNVFSQMAPAFSKGVSASASSLGGGFSAVFGQPSAPAVPQEQTTDPRLVNKASSPSNAFAASGQQPPMANQVFGHTGSADQSSAGWQQNNNWNEDEGAYYEEGEGEGVYYDEHLDGEIDEDDEFALRHADISRRQDEVAQKQAMVDAQLEEMKRMLAEKEAVQQKKKEKKQSELRQSLLKHNFVSQVAQQQIQQSQQRQSSVFDQPRQQQQPLPAITPFFSFTKPTEHSPPKANAFDPPPGASSNFLQNFKLPQPSSESSITFGSLLEKADPARRSDAPSPEPNIPPPQPEPLREPSPPREDPAILLERFSLYAKTRMRDVIQAPNPISRKSIISELQDDLKEALESQPGLEQCNDILATALSNANLAYAAFTLWRKRASAKARKAKMAVLRAEKRRLLAEREKGLGTIEGQWVPVKIKIHPGDSLVKQGDLFRDLNFDEIPLDDIFASPIQKAFTSRGIVRANFSLLCLNAEPRAEYWWLRKFGISSGVGLGVAPRKKKLNNGNMFSVERVLREPDPPTDVGALIFGCRADWNISNEERFAADRRDLHLAVEYAVQNCRYEKLAVMVVCYRSPLDDDDADPFGEDEKNRTGGEERKRRLKAVRKALGLNTLPKERVIVKEIALVETLQDLNLVPAVKRFVKAAAGVVGGEGLGRKLVRRVTMSKESGAELAPYEEIMDKDEKLMNEQVHQRRPAKRKMPLTSPITATSSDNLAVTNGILKKRVSPPPPIPNGATIARKVPATNGKKQQSSAPASDYFILKSHGIHVSPPPIGSTSRDPLLQKSMDQSSTSFNNSHRGHPLPLLTRSSASAAAFAEIVSQSSTSQQGRKRTRASESLNQVDDRDYRESGPPKRLASEERERREIEEHQKRASAIRSALYDFENDPVVMEARRIREAPEYHPELEWPELVMGGV